MTYPDAPGDDPVDLDPGGAPPAAMRWRTWARIVAGAALREGVLWLADALEVTSVRIRAWRDAADRVDQVAAESRAVRDDAAERAWRGAR